jgi:catechol-2,3-dioxygenase
MATENDGSFPVLRQAVLDTTDARGLAEFYRELLGYVYQAGDEPPPSGKPDTKASEWLVVQHRSGSPRIAFEQVAALPSATWPEGPVPQQLHLDFQVPTAEALELHHRRAIALGAKVLEDRTASEEEPLWVFADPAGHPFCIFVATD